MCEWARGVMGRRATTSKALPDGGDIAGQTFCTSRVCVEEGNVRKCAGEGIVLKRVVAS